MEFSYYFCSEFTYKTFYLWLLKLGIKYYTMDKYTH
jgi:hypothetical protein